VRQFRDRESIKKKYSDMVNSPKETGNPDCPEHIRRAKRMYRLITEKVEMAGLDDGDDEFAGSLM